MLSGLSFLIPVCPPTQPNISLMQTSPLTILMKVLHVIGLLLTSIGAFVSSIIRRSINIVYTWCSYLYGLALSCKSPWRHVRDSIPQLLRSIAVFIGPTATEPTPILPQLPEQHLIPSSPGSTTSSTRTERTRTPSPATRRDNTPSPNIDRDDQDFQGMGEAAEEHTFDFDQ
jgi:hypothetical protein